VLITPLFFGLAPAIHAASPGLECSLRDGGRAGGGGVRAQRTRRTLIVVQIALEFPGRRAPAARAGPALAAREHPVRRWPLLYQVETTDAATFAAALALVAVVALGATLVPARRALAARFSFGVRHSAFSILTSQS